MTTTVLYDGILSVADGVMLDVGGYESVAVQFHPVAFKDPQNEIDYATIYAYPHFFGSADGRLWSKIKINPSNNPDDIVAEDASTGGLYFMQPAQAAALQWFMVQIRNPLGPATAVPLHTYSVVITGWTR